jgi:hypothetical protein
MPAIRTVKDGLSPDQIAYLVVGPPRAPCDTPLTCRGLYNVFRPYWETRIRKQPVSYNIKRRILEAIESLHHKVNFNLTPHFPTDINGRDGLTFAAETIA